MLDLKFVRSNLEEIRSMVKNRGYDLDISLFETIDKKRREILPSLEDLRHRRNKVSQEIAEMKKKGEDASQVIAEMKNVSAEIKEKEGALSQIEDQLNPLLMIIPNMPHETVVVGADPRVGVAQNFSTST